MPAPEICPNCGARVPRRAKACPECGSDEQTGWSEEAAGQCLGLPDDSFDYNEFAEREFGTPRPSSRIKPNGLGWGWWITGVILLGLMLWGFSGCRIL